MSMVVGNKDLERIVKRLIENHSLALKSPYVKKPWAWALYQTWKWMDAHEKPREAEMVDNNAQDVNLSNRGEA